MPTILYIFFITFYSTFKSIWYKTLIRGTSLGINTEVTQTQGEGDKTGLS
jgi:hypothetical protein